MEGVHLQANAAANGVTNAVFQVVNLDKAVPSSADGVLQPDVIVAGKCLWNFTCAPI